MNKKKCVAFLMLSSIWFTVNAETQQCPKHGQPIDEEAVIVLSNFAGMVGSFINILQDPHNSENVGHNIGNMVHGIANILTTAITRSIPVMGYINSEQFKDDLEKLIVKKYLKQSIIITKENCQS